jgi:hypothetical protein
VVAARLQQTEAYTVSLPLIVSQVIPGYQPPFGITMFGGVDDSTGLARMKDAGSQWVLTEVSWNWVQPVPGNPYNWAAYDAKFANAAAAGMGLFVIFDDNPAWAAAAPRGPVFADQYPALKQVVQAMAERYNGADGRPRIDYWAFYGEPDGTGAWGNYAADYAVMLKEVAPLVHAANPQARVVLGGLAYDSFTDDELHPGGFVRSFLPDVLQTLNGLGGAANFIDVVAFNFYPISTPRWPTIREKAQEIKSIMTQHGVSRLPVVVTEMSTWSEYDGADLQRQQAQLLVQFYARGLSAGVQKMYWFQVFDLVDNPNTSADDYTRKQGLFVEQDVNAPKPSYFAYRTLAQELNWAPYSGTLSVSGAEGYVFTLNGRPKTVVWGTGPSPVNVNFALTCARRTDLLGDVSLVSDGGPGDLDGAGNGVVRLQVTHNEPIYVGACP